MQISHVRYGITVNLGDYQSAKVEMEAEIETGETLVAALSKLQGAVHQIGEAELRERGNFAGRAAAPGMKFGVVAAPAIATTGATTPAKSRQTAGRATSTKAQPAQATQAEPTGKLLWKKADWESYVAGFDTAGVLDTFKSEMSDAALYADVEAWKTCCEAFADQARRVIGPDDAERTEMVALLTAEKERINNPTPAKKPRAKRKPKATATV